MTVMKLKFVAAFGYLCLQVEVDVIVIVQQRQKAERLETWRQMVK